MGIFSKKTVDQKKERVDIVVKSLVNDSSEYIRNIGIRLNNYLSNMVEPIIKPMYLCVDVVEMIMSNKINFDPSVYEEVLDYAEKVYKDIFIFEEQTDDFQNLEKVYIELFDVNGVVAKQLFDINIFNLFTDKSNFLKWSKVLTKELGNPNNMYYYYSYGAVARGYFYDENMFTANFCAYSSRILTSPNPEAVYYEEVKKIEHMAGIYNVDESRIINAEHFLDCAEQSISKATEILNTIEEKSKTIEKITDYSYNKIKEYCDAQITDSKFKVKNLTNDMNAILQEYAETQKKIILFQKDELINNVYMEAEARLNDMKQAAQLVLASTTADLSRLNKASGEVFNKLNSYIQEDEKVKQLLSNADDNHELMSKIDKLMVLNDSNIEQMTKNIDAINNSSVINDIASGGNIVGVAKPAIVSCSPDIITMDDEEIAQPNFYLTESIDFHERFKLLMEKKEVLKQQGMHFHKKFDDVLIAVMENANPYLIGPTGCGKTYMVTQMAKLFEIDFVDIGYINEEYDILGFQTANGGYSKPNFYRCYKYGKIAFCDELDNGNSKATVKLNSFLSNTTYSSYSFPNGENVQRHNNFRVIAAGNTAGNGADENYNTREKIEESVQQRLLPIYIDYDNEVEKTILGDYVQWYEFVVAFRAATDAWGKDNYGDAPGIITTRDVTRIKKYLDNQSFTTSQIIDYEFIETKDINYLTFLDSHMKNNSGALTNATELIKMFSNKVEQLRNN